MQSSRSVYYETTIERAGQKKIGKLNETFRLNFLHPDRFVIKTATNKIVVTLWGGQLDRKFQEIQIESRRRAFVSRCNKCD
jgi:hypothetical protein